MATAKNKKKKGRQQQQHGGGDRELKEKTTTSKKKRTSSKHNVLRNRPRPSVAASHETEDHAAHDVKNLDRIATDQSDQDEQEEHEAEDQDMFKTAFFQRSIHHSTIISKKRRVVVAVVEEKEEDVNADGSNTFRMPIRDCSNLYVPLRTWNCAMYGSHSSIATLNGEDQQQQQQQQGQTGTTINNNNNQESVLSLSSPSSTFCCIPCAYKVGCFDVALDKAVTSRLPNQRPEQCHRLLLQQHEQQSEPMKTETTKVQEEAEGDDDDQAEPMKTETIKVQEEDEEDDESPEPTTGSEQLLDMGPLGYHPGMKILTVGDGDFSFSLALARLLCCRRKGDDDNKDKDKDNKTKSKTRIVATSYESKETLQTVYSSSFSQVLSELEQYEGVQILYEIDATRLTDYTGRFVPNGDAKAAVLFDRIVWNFPCSAVDNGQDGQNNAMDENKRLISLFVQQVVGGKSGGGGGGGGGTTTTTDTKGLLLNPKTGQIHMNHKTKPPFDQWKLEEVALSQIDTSCGLRFWGRVVWDRALFPPYIPRKALHTKSFSSHDACTFIFAMERQQPQQQVQEQQQTSQNSNNDACNNQSCNGGEESVSSSSPSSCLDRLILDQQSGTTAAPRSALLVPLTAQRIQILRSKLLKQAEQKQLMAALSSRSKNPKGYNRRQRRRGS